MYTSIISLWLSVFLSDPMTMSLSFMDLEADCNSDTQVLDEILHTDLLRSLPCTDSLQHTHHKQSPRAGSIVHTQILSPVVSTRRNFAVQGLTLAPAPNSNVISKLAAVLSARSTKPV
jgi:hypothetical protein